jgi:tetratricopeptide (TPR) repeat protein
MRFGTGNKGLIMLVALPIFFGNACSQVKEENKVDKVQEYTEKAREFRIKGDSQNALKEQLKAVEANPIKAVEANPNDDDSLMLLGGIYIELKQYDKAVEVLQKSTLINSKNGSAYYLLAWALEELNKDKEALEAIKKAVEIRPNEVSYVLSLGGNYEETGDSKAAKESFEKALKLNPDYIPAIYWLGTLEAEEGNIKKALEIFEKAVNTTISEENDKVYVDLCRKELLKLQAKKP